MKSYFLILSVFCLVLMSCKNKVEDPKQLVDDTTILHINDSITQLAADFQKNNDTTLLKKAIDLSDKVLTLDMTEEGQYYGTLRKSQLLSLLGNKKEAFFLQDKIIDKNPDSIERLIYNGVSAKLKAQPDSSEMFFSKAFDQCRKQLILNPDRAELNVSIATIYIYQGKKAEAIKEIDQALAKFPDSQPLVSFKSGIDKAYDNAQKFLEGK